MSEHRASGRHVLVVYGTRPEAIKCAPVIHRLQEVPGITPTVLVTGQHREMLDQVNSLFAIKPDHDLDIIRPGQSLTDVTVGALGGLSTLLKDLAPDAVLVQGDTTTAFAAGLAAFYAQIPVIHLEAGLRTGNLFDPFPEEMNRRLVAQLAAVHLAPTATARANLIEEGVSPDLIHVTGNTVIDALLEVRDLETPVSDPMLTAIGHGPVVLVTTHRRESWGEPMARTGRALASLARRFPEVTFLLPAHLNPVVRETILPPVQDLPNVVITEPLSYADLAYALGRCSFVLTDSGGIQEEAPSLGKPVLVLRETTERPEAVTAGTVRLVGTDEETIVAEATALLTEPTRYDDMARAVNPYGDGQAARRSVEAIAHLFGLGDRPESFVPERTVSV